MFKNYLIILFVLLCIYTNYTNAIEPVRTFNLTIGSTAYRYINSHYEDIYRVTYNSTFTTLNITAWTNATSERPLLIVIRQEKGLISLQLPNKETSKSIYRNVSRILCPSYTEPDSNGQSTVFIDIYTSSDKDVAYAIQANYFTSFILNENSHTNLLLSPNAPVFFQYNLKPWSSSIVTFKSEDRVCTTVSVQRMACPVFDLKHTIDFNGQYQTMTKISAISVANENDKPKSMYVVVSVHSTDKDCCDDANCSQSVQRIKNLTIDILPGYKDSSVNLSYAITLSVFLAAYIIISGFLCFIEPYSEKSLKPLIEEYASSRTIITTIDTVNRLSYMDTLTKRNNNLLLNLPNVPLNNESVETSNNVAVSITDEIPSSSSPQATLKTASSTVIQPQQQQQQQQPVLNFSHAQAKNRFPRNNTSSLNDENSTNVPSTTIDISNNLSDESVSGNVYDDNSFSSSEYDKVDDLEYYKETVRNKPNIKVWDLARKQPKLLERKIMNYPRLIIAIATFYVLPVIQLVLMYQTQLIKSGNEDSCYFNFLCVIKFGPMAAFNNVFSNVGYVLLGIMFIIVVKKRAYAYKYMRRKYPVIIHNHGIPQHFGLFYTMGIGLIMEGILSAAYHTCPSYSNFQFDTSFMYVIGVINIIKLYQCRHPDINPSSQKVFLFLACCILLNVVGVFYGKNERWFMIVYCIIHITFFVCMSVIVYYMKQPKLSTSALKKIRTKWRQNGIFTKPIHLERLVMLIIANAFNWGLALYAAIRVPEQFSSHLLNVFLGNFLLYFIMYLINKLIHREKFHTLTIVNLIVATAAWIGALYFFGIEVKYWEKKPAESREANKSCILLNIYDHHDVWHFMSALSMFMSFVVMLTLDDGIIHIKRELIPAF